MVRQRLDSQRPTWRMVFSDLPSTAAKNHKMHFTFGFRTSHPWLYAKKHQQRGIALLVTISIISLLVASGLQLNRRMLAAMTASATDRDRLTLSQMATAGIHGAMAMLIQDKYSSTTDSIQEDWADPEIIEELLAEMPFKDGKVGVVITDELSRIQINALVKFPEGRQFNASQHALWERFANRILSLYKDVADIEETDPATIIDAIKDWLDSGDDDAITGLNGAESDYYQDLNPPYECKNGPFADIGEVSLVKGVTPELFYGFGELLGLSSYLTAFGATETTDKKFTFEGKININTAELPVLAALLPTEAQDFAQVLYDYRISKADKTYVNDLTSPNWYKNVPGADGIDPGLISVSSDFFRITATASLHNVKTAVTAVVHREKNEKSGKWMCKILNWQVE
jgi:general secretion pathway protein K